jgi:hypothetical protein
MMRGSNGWAGAGALALVAAWGLTGCDEPGEPGDGDDSEVIAVPTWEEFAASARRGLDDGGETYVVEWDIGLSRAELRTYYDENVAPRAKGAVPVDKSTVNRVGGVDDVWTTAQKMNLTYCVSDTFGANKARAVAEMNAATAAWENNAKVNFIYRPAQDASCSNANPNVVFAVRPWSSGGACAFFPSGGGCVPRTVVVDYPDLDNNFEDIAPNMTTTGVLRHELGHVLGLRHEHTRPESGVCFEDNSWRALTSYDQYSLMHYPWCNGWHESTLSITTFDGAGVRELYGPGFTRPALWVGNYGYDAGGWRVESHPRLLGDVNADGRDDIVGFGNDGAWVSLSTGTGYSAPALWVGNYGYNAGGWRVERHPRFLADVDADGRDDIVGFGNDGAWVSRSTGAGFTAPALWVGNYGYNAGGWRVESHPRLMGDLNADGRADIVGFGNDGAWVSLSTGTGFTAPALWVGNYGYNAGGWRVERHPRVLADVNADGRDDIVGFGNDATWVSLSTGTGFGAPTAWVASYGYNAGGWRVERHPRVLADVNDDGRADVVGFGNAGAYVSLSSGAGFAAPALWVGNYGYDAGGWRVENHPRALADVNNDGRADIVGFGNDGVWVSRSTGTGFRTPQLWVNNYGYVAGGWRVERHPRLMGDVNADGSADIVGFGNAGAWVSKANP